MQRTLLRVTSFLAVALACRVSAAESISWSGAFDSRALRFSRMDGYDRVTLGDLVPTFTPGEPQVPFATVLLVLPAGSEVDSVEITDTRSQLLPYELVLRPAQPPRVLSALHVDRQPRAFAEPKQSVYGAAQAYPPEIVRHLGTGSCGGWTVAAFAVRPLQYLPRERRCVFHERLSFTASYRDAKTGDRIVPRDAAPALGDALGCLVSNSKDIDACAPARAAAAKDDLARVEYVIVTDDAFAAAFKPLADWKTKKGVPAAVFTTSWIYANYAGADNQAKIREFLKSAARDRGTAWVLLGGDTAYVPERRAFALASHAGFDADEDNIPCDLYYADLDGTWNAGGDPAVYGEVVDDVDLLPDVFVGRAPARTVAQAQTFVAKVLRYEKDPPRDYLRRVLFAAEILWSNPYTDQGIAKDRIDTDLIPDRFAITKLYARDGTESRAAVRNALNGGMHIFNHDGHAWYTVMQVGSGSLTIADIDGLANGAQQTVLYSIGCWQAAFDRDTIAEHCINNPLGGCVANIGNSRYGWGAIGEPGFGYSDRYDREFYRIVFVHGERRVGAAMALSKATFAPLAREANVYRWCQYELNLLGDPEMMLWTDTPESLTVAHPSSVPTGNAPFPVAVTHEGVPVADALVCVMKEEEVYATGRTDASGRLVLAIAPTSPVGSLLVTVTAGNFLPSETTAQVIAGGAYIAEDGVTVAGAAGAEEGLIAPGATAQLAIALHNFGSADARGVTAILESASPGIAVTAGAATYGQIPAGTTAQSADRFTVVADGGLTNGETVYLKLLATDADAHRWERLLALRAATPHVVCRALRTDDRAYGDGDGVLEAGERVELVAYLENLGLATARDVTCVIASVDAYLALDPNPIDIDSLAPGGLRTAVVAATIDEACPVPRRIDVLVEVSAAGQAAAVVNKELIAGRTGFSDDVESGTAGWTVPGGDNLWHVTSHRSHSGSYSWYCGLEGSWTYAPDNESVLLGAPFDVCREPVLSFWAWYDVAMYGTTGVYVEVSSDGTTWEKLDFIGSGGALNPLLMGNGWARYSYDLSAHAPATPLRVRFRFVSDNSAPLEGVYIDDIAVESASEDIAAGFVRGDGNGDGKVDLADAIAVLAYLFAGGPEGGCRDAADANDDGRRDLSDAVRVLLYLFKGWTFEPPLGVCGVDTTADELDCATLRACDGETAR